MTVPIIRTKPEPLEGWIIAQSNGLCMLGKPDSNDPQLLSPVYELLHAVHVNPQTGQTVCRHSVLPLFAMPSVRGSAHSGGLARA